MSDDIQLPELPRHQYCLNSQPVLEGYAAHQMQEFARAAVLADRNRRAQPAPGAEALTDSQRIDWLEQAANAPGGLLLHDGTVKPPRLGLGLRPGSVRRSLREAIDTAIAAHSAGKAQQTGEGE